MRKVFSFQFSVFGFQFFHSAGRAQLSQDCNNRKFAGISVFDHWKE
jgi:hypothetical protein